MIYLVKKDDSVLVFHSEGAMKEAGCKKADKIIGEDEFNSAGCYARLVGGSIVIGKTEAEKQAEANGERIARLKQMLAGTDYIAVKIAEGSADVSQYAEKIAQRQAWRAEIQSLESA